MAEPLSHERHLQLLVVVIPDLKLSQLLHHLADKADVLDRVAELFEQPEVYPFRAQTILQLLEFYGRFLYLQIYAPKSFARNDELNDDALRNSFAGMRSCEHARFCCF